MPIRRNRYRKRSTVTKRKYPYRRRRMVPRPVGRTTTSNFFFKRFLTPGALSTTNGFLFNALSWSLNDLPSVSEFTNLFDQYRICGVRLLFSWRSSTISAIETNNNNLAGMPIMHHVIDLDDSTVPSSLADLNQYGKVRKTYFGTTRRLKSLFFKPRFRNLIEATAGTAYTLGNRKSWLDINNSTVDHYGFKFAIEVPQGAGTKVEAYVDVETQLYLQFRQTR